MLYLDDQRPKEVIVLRTKFWPRMVVFTAPLLLIFIIGYMINGMTFFSINYLSQVNSAIINEYVGFASLAIFFIICLRNILVLTFSKGVLISIRNDHLIINGFKKIPLNVVNVDSIRLINRNRSRLIIGLNNGKSIGLSVAFAQTKVDIASLVSNEIEFRRI